MIKKKFPGFAEPQTRVELAKLAEEMDMSFYEEVQSKDHPHCVTLSLELSKQERRNRRIPYSSLYFIVPWNAEDENIKWLGEAMLRSGLEFKVSETQCNRLLAMRISKQCLVSLSRCFIQSASRYAHDEALLGLRL